MGAREDMENFIEHCVMAAAGDPGITDGEPILRALRLVAEAFCPDLLNAPNTFYNMETEEITVETKAAIYTISVRAVER